jgi:MFS family permease
MNDPSATAIDARAQVSGLFRWGALFMMSFVVLAVYFAYDSLNPIGQLLKDNLDISASQFGTLKQSATSIPNVVLLIFGGVMLDRLGTRIGGGIVAGFCAVGTVVTAVGAYAESYWIMILGRILFGAGVETLIVAQNKVVAKWFTGRELSLAFAVNLALCRFGTLFAFNSMVGLSDTFGWQGALVVVAGIMIGGFLIFLSYAGMDRWIERKVKVEEERSERIDLKYLFGLPRQFWLITMLCLTFYCAVFPLLDFAPQIFEARFGMSDEYGSWIAGTVILLTIIFTPIFGHICDRFGKLATIMVIGSLMLIPIHLSLGFLEGGDGAHPTAPLFDAVVFKWYEAFPLSATDIVPILPMMLLGISFSLVPAAMWPAVAKMVEQSRLGTAYAIMFLIQNIGLMLLSPLVGWGEMPSFAEGTFEPFQVSTIILASLGTLGFVFAVLLKVSDRKSKTSIETPEGR